MTTHTMTFTPEEIENAVRSALHYVANKSPDYPALEWANVEELAKYPAIQVIEGMWKYSESVLSAMHAGTPNGLHDAAARWDWHSLAAETILQYLGGLNTVATEMEAF